MANSLRNLPRAFRWLALALLLPALLLALTLLIAEVWSPRGGGQPIAAALYLPHPLVIAHRGLSYWAPEETRAAYLLARELGADYLEADVQRSKDGVLLALHDDTLDRTTDVAAVFPARKGQGAGAFTWDELQRLDAGAWFNRAHPDRARPAYVGLRMLRIADLSALAREPARGGQRSPGLYLETKDPDKYPGYEQQLVELLGAAGWLAAPPPGAPPPLLFQSFDEASLQRLAALAPAVPRVLLIEDNAESRAKWGELLKRGRALGMGIGPSGHEGWPWFTGAAHRAGLQVHLYTINEAWQLRLLRQFGADGFFTDTADLALAVLGRGADPGLDREQARAAAFARAGL